jgi:hypothetical protein
MADLCLLHNWGAITHLASYQRPRIRRTISAQPKFALGDRL